VLAIDFERLPVQDGVAQVADAASVDEIDLAAAAGEDYELLCSLPAEHVDAATDAVASTGTILTAIGEVRSAGPDGAGVSLRDSKGKRQPRGFDQLRSP
jgi:thiamine-monophosphate kinase